MISNNSLCVWDKSVIDDMSDEVITQAIHQDPPSAGHQLESVARPVFFSDCKAGLLRFNSASDYRKLSVSINRTARFTFVAALAEDFGVPVNEQNELDQ